MFRGLLRTLVLPVPLVVGSCGEAREVPTARSRTAIVGGEVSPSGLEDAVLLLQANIPDAGERLCGASLVARNLVVTARHCVAFMGEGDFRCEADGTLVEREQGSGAGRLGLDVPAENLEFYANATPRTEPIAIGARVVSTLSELACANDLAFVVLDRSLDLPLLGLRRSRPTLPGEAVAAVGYGAQQGSGQTLDFETLVRRRKTDLTIAAVGPDKAGAVGTVPPRIVIVEGQSACHGDSGGPLLSRETNALVAVHSLIEGDCVAADTRNWYTHVPPLVSFAERAFEEAGATPIFEEDREDPPCDACAGAGGSVSGGAAGDAAAAGTGDSTSGAGGDVTDPIEPPDTTPPRARMRESGCSLPAVRVPSSGAVGGLTLVFLSFLRRSRWRSVTCAGRSSA
jgi:hypothetical protein